MEKVIHKVIESEKPIRLLHKHIKAYNKDKSLGLQIREQHTKTAETIFKIAIKKNVNFSNPLHTSLVELGQERYVCGYFKDNGASIASQLNIHVKSLDSHIERLALAGILTAYKVTLNGGNIRKKGNHKETLFAINSQFFNLSNQ
ncbi:MAG: hypothetical protein CMO01_31400 [Thalassobius sp.]|nr:hypothetical protein [Thalassovita sp.]